VQALGNGPGVPPRRWREVCLCRRPCRSHSFRPNLSRKVETRNVRMQQACSTMRRRGVAPKTSLSHFVARVHTACPCLPFTKDIDHVGRVEDAVRVERHPTSKNRDGIKPEKAAASHPQRTVPPRHGNPLLGSRPSRALLDSAMALCHEY